MNIEAAFVIILLYIYMKRFRFIQVLCSNKIMDQENTLRVNITVYITTDRHLNIQPLV